MGPCAAPTPRRLSCGARRDVSPVPVRPEKQASRALNQIFKERNHQKRTADRHIAAQTFRHETSGAKHSGARAMASTFYVEVRSRADLERVLKDLAIIGGVVVSAAAGPIDPVASVHTSSRQRVPWLTPEFCHGNPSRAMDDLRHAMRSAFGQREWARFVLVPMARCDRGSWNMIELFWDPEAQSQLPAGVWPPSPPPPPPAVPDASVASPNWPPPPPPLERQGSEPRRRTLADLVEAQILEGMLDQESPARVLVFEAVD